MAHPSRLLCLALLLTPALAQKPTDRLVVPDGLSVGLFAESPQLYNPTAIDVDHRGRVWVTEAVNYRTWRRGNQGPRHAAGDRVVILTDADGDGRCDAAKVFVQEKDLVAPLGICVIGAHVLVSCSPHAILYTDSDGDDVPDKREVFLTGFGGRDHDHGLHSFVAGPDGWLYFNAGNAGPHIVRDRGGRLIRSGSIYRDGGRNRPGLVSDDGRVWTGGLVMRVRPDGTGLTVLAHNFRNPYEVSVDAFGDLFQSDNDDDGNRGCRTSWVMEGGNYGYFSADGTRSWRADQRPGQSTWVAHWHQDDPGVLPAGASNGGGGPTGVAVYEGPLLPAAQQGMVLNCDAGAGVVYGHLPRWAGTAAVEMSAEHRIDFMRVAPGTGGDRAKWFRPSDVAVGPDGAVYVADWYDPGVGGHAMGDRAAYGRILRVAKPGMAKVAVDLQSDAGLVAALDSPAPDVRGLAFRRLRARGARGVPLVAEVFRAAGDLRRRARALYWLAGAENGVEFVREGLKCTAPELRVVAVRAARLHHGAEAAFEMIRGLATDADARVRREVTLALAGIPLEQCKAELLALARAGGGRTHVEALGTAARGREADVYALLLAELGDQPLKWTPGFAQLAWRLHPVEAVPALFARALSPTLPLAARRQAIDAIGFVPHRTAAEAMLSIAQAGPEDTQALSAFWVRHRSTNDWSAFGLARHVAERKDGKLAWSSGLMRSGSKAFDVAVAPGAKVWLVVTDGGDGFSCDWADWIDPAFQKDGGGAVALATLPWLSSKTGWGSVGIDKNAGGGKLSLDGRKRLRGIGTHAPAELAWQVPAGAVRLTGRVGPDAGGKRQNGGQTTSVEFQVWVEAPEDRSHLVAWRKTILDAGLDKARRVTACREMAADRDGGLVLLGLVERGQLPADLRQVVAAAIFENPDQGVRLLATKHFSVPGLEAAKLPPIEAIAKLRGDPGRGATHFARSCAACHVFGGKGRDIGPGLDDIHRKYGAPALLEAILNPNAAVAFGYESWVIETKDGELLMGFILAEGEKVVVKDQTGARHVLDKGDIASRQKSPTSLMPAGIVAGMSAQDLADLAAHLLEPGEGK